MFPKELAGRSIKDPEMLQWWNNLGVMLLTRDSSMASDHTRFVPNYHKGIVVICNGGKTPLGHGKIPVVLSAFKRALPQWPSLHLDNALLELWADSPSRDVTVARIKDGTFQWYEDFSFGDPDWPQPFLRALSRASNS